MMHNLKTIGIIGGGTAGYLSALAFRHYFPKAKITLIESDRLPIIGVGEATTPPLVDFLHRILGFEKEEFYKIVQPTLKYGTHFKWGLQAPYSFNYPFEPQEIYLAYEIYRDPIRSSLQSLLMNYNKSFLYKEGDQIKPINSIYKKGNYAYHLENRKFVAYLKKKAAEHGIVHVIDTVKNVLTDSNDGSIKSIKLEGESSLSFDFYVDCSGFTSLLLEKSLQTPFISFSSSLFTNSAITATTPNGNILKPYTTASTMNHGWLWNTPLRDTTHIGYVYSNQFASEEEIINELKVKHPSAKDFKLVKFKSGRHEKALNKNVLAIGNAFGFVEPLESSGIHMIVSSLKTFGLLFKDGNLSNENYNQFNFIINDKWDQLRWFLSLHFKFNKSLNTPFWVENRNNVNFSGYENLIEIMKKDGPLRQSKHMNNESIKKQLENSLIKFSGLDTFLVAQNILPNEKNDKFIKQKESMLRTKFKIWNELIKKTLPHKEALEYIENNSSILYQ